jgi:hypothetical protein
MSDKEVKTPTESKEPIQPKLSASSFQVLRGTVPKSADVK